MIPENFRISDKILTIPENGGFKTITIDNIISFVSCASGTNINCIDEEDSTVCKATLDSLETIFAPKGFYRIHKSSMINTRHIKRFDHKKDDMLMMCKDKKYPVARARRSDFEEAMLKPYRDLMTNTTVRSPKTTVQGNRFTVRGFSSNGLWFALYICRILYDTAPVETFLF